VAGIENFFLPVFLLVVTILVAPEGDRFDTDGFV
jgi:hypothetical protein